MEVILYIISSVLFFKLSYELYIVHEQEKQLKKMRELRMIMDKRQQEAYKKEFEDDYQKRLKEYIEKQNETEVVEHNGKKYKIKNNTIL